MQQELLAVRIDIHLCRLQFGRAHQPEGKGKDNGPNTMRQDACLLISFARRLLVTVIWSSLSFRPGTAAERIRCRLVIENDYQSQL